MVVPGLGGGGDAGGRTGGVAGAVEVTGRIRTGTTATTAGWARGWRERNINYSRSGQRKQGDRQGKEGETYVLRMGGGRRLGQVRM